VDIPTPVEHSGHNIRAIHNSHNALRPLSLCFSWTLRTTEDRGTAQRQLLINGVTKRIQLMYRQQSQSTTQTVATDVNLSTSSAMVVLLNECQEPWPHSIELLVRTSMNTMSEQAGESYIVPPINSVI